MNARMMSQGLVASVTIAIWGNNEPRSILADHPQLKSLAIEACRLDDEGVRQVGQLTNLEHLGLVFVPLRDEQLSHLEKLPDLKKLELIDTGASMSRIESLKKSLPNCRISAR